MNETEKDIIYLKLKIKILLNLNLYGFHYIFGFNSYILQLIFLCSIIDDISIQTVA